MDKNEEKEKVREFVLQEVKKIHEVSGGEDLEYNIKEKFFEECDNGEKDGFSIDSQMFDIIVKEMLKENADFAFDVNVFSVATELFVSPPPSHFIKPIHHSHHFVVLHFFQETCFVYDSIPKYNTKIRDECVKKLVKDKEIIIKNTGPQGNNDCAFFALSTIASLVGFPLPLFQNSLSRRKFFMNIARKKSFDDDPFLNTMEKKNKDETKYLYEVTELQDGRF